MEKCDCISKSSLFWRMAVSVPSCCLPWCLDCSCLISWCDEPGRASICIYDYNGDSCYLMLIIFDVSMSNWGKFAMGIHYGCVNSFSHSISYSLTYQPVRCQPFETSEDCEGLIVWIQYINEHDASDNWCDPGQVGSRCEELARSFQFLLQPEFRVPDQEVLDATVVLLLYLL